MDFRLLGPLEVRDDDRVLTLGAAKQRALLTTLLLHANEVVSADRLIEELWGDERPPTAENTLQAYVSRLRARWNRTAPAHGRARPQGLVADPRAYNVLCSALGDSEDS